MNVTDIAANIVARIGGAMIRLRSFGGVTDQPAFGGAPIIPEAKPQNIPTLKMPTAKGWVDGHVPTAAPGLKVNALASGLDHPRWIYVMPNGDVLVAESMGLFGKAKTAFEYAAFVTMSRAGARGRSANRITLLRDADGDGVAETQKPFLENLYHPFGMELVGDKFYVGNTDGIVVFPYQDGQGKITAKGEKLVDFRPAGHWTRSLLASSDKTKLYAGVGSLTNIADKGFEEEEGRALIYELDLATGEGRPFATGLRNAVGMAFEPTTGVLWTVVNERDGLGDEVPPDYLTSVQRDGFYGWPYCYWGQTIDDRVPQNPELVAKAVCPDYALGGHTASLGLCWLPEGILPGFGNGMVIGQHGSWNRSQLSGYKVIFVPFENGKPSGEPRDILSGFLSADEKQAYGRPVGVTLGPDNSLLVADDVGNVIWRVTAA